MKHELIVKVEPLGPPKRKTEKPADLDDVWYPVPGKPDFEVNGRGQLRTKVDLPPAAPAPAYSFVGEPIRLHYSTGQELRPVRSAAARKVWFADGKYHEMEIDLEQPIEPPITDSAAYRSLWGYWSADVVNRILKERELDAAVTVAPPSPKLNSFEIGVLEGCRGSGSSTLPAWLNAAKRLVGLGLLRECPFAKGSTYWPSYSTTPEGLRASRLFMQAERARAAAEREHTQREYWGRSIPAMLGDAVAAAAVTVAPPTTGSGLQLLMNADRERERTQRTYFSAPKSWGRVKRAAAEREYTQREYWSVDDMNRILKEYELDDEIKVV